MDHVVIPLDRDHVNAASALTVEAATAMHGPPPDRSQPHVTLVAFRGVTREAVLDAVRAASAGTAPFVLRAHGFGVFARTGRSGLSLHVPVVRGRDLDRLHGVVTDLLVAAGAEVAGWSHPDLWSPHITLLDRDLDAAHVGAALAHLAARHHPSWHVPVDRLQVRGGWADRDGPTAEVLLRGSR